MKLANTPPKGTADWFPEEYKIRKYIFDTWREVCLSYGYEEYLGPLVESVDIWKAKSGEDVGGSELTQITNRDGVLDGLAIRPEMTPTVTRMASRIWKETDKPIKWFSIANYYRNEKPQKGRNREFWQLNADVFGEESLGADIEILTLALETLRAFSPPKGSYILKLNHRALIQIFLSEILGVSDIDEQKQIIRLMDKYEKLPMSQYKEKLYSINPRCDYEMIEKFMKARSIEDLSKSFSVLTKTSVFQDFTYIISTLTELGYGEEVEFSGSLMRGFDYYDGLIFEMFDTHPDNSRSLFGGGRYNGLASIFGIQEGIPAIGFAPGDEPMRLFLEGHGLLDVIQHTYSQKYYFPLLSQKLFSDAHKIAKILRLAGKQVYLGCTEKKLQKSLRYAIKHKYSHIIIYGSDEQLKKQYIIKDLHTQTEKIMQL